MEASFAQLANRSVVPGATKSLVDVGYTYANLDDGYQACGAGVNGSFHDARGFPILDAARFPNVSAMTARARALGLTPGFYCNNYICSEPTPYGGVNGDTYNRVMRGSVQFLVDNGFGFVKVDSGSCYNDMQLWQELIEASGAPIKVENCHQGDLAPNATWCPFDQWRVGADVNGEGPDFELLQVARALPSARAHCWPYADFMALDAGAVGPRSLFGLYAVTGTPMVFSFDVRDDALLPPLFATLTNEEVIAVNRDETAPVGALLRKFSAHAAGDAVFAWAEGCNASEPLQGGWAFDAAARRVTWTQPGAPALCLAAAALGASLALAECSAAPDAAQTWLASGGRLWQAQAPGRRALAGVGDLALADCAPADERPGQQWTISGGVSTPTNIQLNLSTRMGGCWEITACDFGQGADLGTTYGCKPLPPPGDSSPCDSNGVFSLNANGTITSVMSGNCVEVEGDAAGARVEVSRCTQQPRQRWTWPAAAAGATATGQIRSVSHPTQCVDDGDVPAPPGTTGACARLRSSWGFDGPAVELASPESNGAPCEPSNAPAPDESVRVDGGALKVGAALCVAGRRGAPTPFGPLQLWAKPLAAGAAAVLLANRDSGGAADATVSVALSEVPGLAAAAAYSVRDLWLHAVVANATAGGAFNLTAAPGSTMFVVVSPLSAQ